MPRFPAKMINLRASICPKNQAFFFLPIASFIPDYSLSEGEQKTIHLLSTFKQDWMQSSWSGTLPFQDMLTACAHLSYACSLFSVCWSTGTFWSQSWAVQAASLSELPEPMADMSCPDVWAGLDRSTRQQSWRAVLCACCRLWCVCSHALGMARRAVTCTWLVLSDWICSKAGCSRCCRGHCALVSPHCLVFFKKV